MEIRDELDKNIYVCLLITFALATIAVFGYMFIGLILCVYIALGVYAFSFSLLSLSSIRKLFQISHYKDRLIRAEITLIEKGEEITEFSERKKDVLSQLQKLKQKEIIKAILSGVFGLFTIVVLVLF